MIKTPLYIKLLNYDFEKLFKEKGYKYFTKGIYNLNIIGVRATKGDIITNKYDDYIVVLYNTPSGPQRKIFTCTTEPGLYYMYHFMNPAGTAILAPGQYVGCWHIAKHRGKYQALCQKKAVTVYRDTNKDDKYDLDPRKKDTGVFGINIHRASQWSETKTIDKYSAGCQVLNNPSQFNSFMYLCRKQAELYGNSFTYTLVNEKDLK